MKDELFSGGQGGGTIRSSLRMAKQAIDNGWPVSPEVRSLVIAKAKEIVESEDPREQLAAMKVLVAADSVNVKREAIAAKLDETPSNTTNVFNWNVFMQGVGGNRIEQELKAIEAVVESPLKPSSNGSVNGNGKH